MAVGSRALKEAKLESVKKRRKRGQQSLSDLSVAENLEPESLNLTQEMSMEEQIPLEEDMGILPKEVGLPEAMDDPLLSLEDQILSRMDNQGRELAPSVTPFNSNFADDIPESVRDKIAAYLEEVTEKDKKNRAPWLDIIEKAKNLLGFKIEEIQDGDNGSTRKSNSSIGNSAQVKTYDTTFSSSVLRLWATLRSELLPATGPV